MDTNLKGDLSQEIARLEEEISHKKKLLMETRRRLPRREITDYIFSGPDGKVVRLSEMFGSHSELIIIHNMGKGCPYCTLWADGFNGIVNHLENRAGFAVISPDDPKIQREFAVTRGWHFQLYSGKGSSFTLDMGFQTGDKEYMPGVSSFFKDSSGKIYQIARTNFGPGDDFCSAWHLFDLLPGGSDDWRPKFEY